MRVFLAGLVLILGMSGGRAQPAPDPTHPDTFLLTIFLRHDETKTLGEINDHLRQTG